MLDFFISYTHADRPMLVQALEARQQVLGSRHPDPAV
jgi:hypothetical protein